MVSCYPSLCKLSYFRDNYDKEVKAAKQNHKGRFNPFHKAKRPDAAVYIPPSRKNDEIEPEQQQQQQQESSGRATSGFLC